MERKVKQRKNKQVADPNWAGKGIKMRNRKALQTMFSENKETMAMIPELAGNKSLAIAQKVSAANQVYLTQRADHKKEKKESRRWKGGDKAGGQKVKKAALVPDSVLISKVLGKR